MNGIFAILMFFFFLSSFFSGEGEGRGGGGGQKFIYFFFQCITHEIFYHFYSFAKTAVLFSILSFAFCATDVNGTDICKCVPVVVYDCLGECSPE